MKNQIKLFCIALAGAFMLTACGGPKLIGVTLPETPLVLATGETATAETSYTYDAKRQRTPSRKWSIPAAMRLSPRWTRTVLSLAWPRAKPPSRPPWVN